MRYQIGQKIPVVACIVNGNSQLGVTIPLLYDNQQPNNIFMKMLTVKEHHRVPNYFETNQENKEHDGYILSDEQGGRWFNQYPRASYGQLSDKCDRQFYSDLQNATEEEFKSALDNQEKYPQFYELLSDHIERILRGIEQLPHDHEKVAQLNRLLITTESKANETFPGFKYEYVPVVFINNDGSQSSHHDIKHVVITVNGEVL